MNTPSYQVVYTPNNTPKPQPERKFYIDGQNFLVTYSCSACKSRTQFPDSTPRQEIKVWCCGKWVYLKDSPEFKKS